MPSSEEATALPAKRAVRPLLPASFALSSDLPDPRRPLGHLKLQFSHDQAGGDELMRDLSACALVGNVLFVAGDECAAVERLTLREDGTLGDHVRFPLADLLDLADPDGEMDIEGLAFEDGWLWITGSHARTRADPADDGTAPGKIDTARLADLEDTRPRCLLARVPVADDDQGLPRLYRYCATGKAGLVKQNRKHGSKLAKQIEKDPLLGPSTRLAAKEGGLDIEGIGVAGDRVALGLRGPVLQTYAMLIEPQLKPKKSGKIQLSDIPRKRMLDLSGLGIRDLCVDGDDLYILAGPTQGHDGRCSLYRWPGWRSDPPEDEEVVRLHRPDWLFDLPIRSAHDHPEAIDIWPGIGGKPQLLVLYDSPAEDRIDAQAATILADLFELG